MVGFPPLNYNKQKCKMFPNDNHPGFPLTQPGGPSKGELKTARVVVACETEGEQLANSWDPVSKLAFLGAWRELLIGVPVGDTGLDSNPKPSEARDRDIPSSRAGCDTKKACTTDKSCETPEKKKVYLIDVGLGEQNKSNFGR